MKTPRKNTILICALLIALFAAGCEKPPGTSESATHNSIESHQSGSVAVSSSYLEAALRDIVHKDMPLVRLAGPNMCPGHFDMRPGQMSDLSRCRLLVRFDFQQAIDEKLGERGSLQTLSVTVPDGMCVPESYLSVCRQLADHYVSTGEMSRNEVENRLDQISERMIRLRNSIMKQMEAPGLCHAPVLASRHQAEFCRWLGLQVTATFSGSDTAGTREISEAVTAAEKAGVSIIIANEPEGRRLADALADHLRAKVVVFANFPEPEKNHAFDHMVRRNVEALLAVGQSSPEKQ